MPLPTFIPPMLATPGPLTYSKESLYEPKWDGLRCLAFKDKRLRLMSRNGRDMTAHFPDLADLAHCLHGEPWVLDGELVIFDDTGKASFDLVRDRNLTTTPTRITHLAQCHPAVLIVFDLLYHRGISLMDKMLRARRSLLEQHLEPGQHVALSPAVVGAGPGFHQTVVHHGCEGTMIKRLESPYAPGSRSPYWIKVRNVKETDCVIGGFVQRGPQQLASLLLGQHLLPAKTLHYVGRVGAGFSENQSQTLLNFLYRILTHAPPFTAIAPNLARGASWVRPIVVCRVEYLTWTAKGLLRHPVFRGIRSDKPPLECLLAADHPSSTGASSL